jgi:hypothetical protein
MITQFDKTTCRLLAAEIEAALAAVAAKHGLTIKPAGGTFSANEFSTKVKFALSDSNPAAADAERTEFAKYAHFYGLTADQYGATIRTSQGDVTLIGFAASRPKFPIKVRTADGKVKLYTENILAITRLVASVKS